MNEKVKVKFTVWDYALKTHPTEKRSVEIVTKEKLEQFFQKFWEAFESPEKGKFPIDFTEMSGEVLLSDWPNLLVFITSRESLYEFSFDLCDWTTPGAKRIVTVMQKKL